MKKAVTVVSCDVCGKEMNGDKFMEGKVLVGEKNEIRFDICAEDVEKLFGTLPLSKRRGRVVESAEEDGGGDGE